MGRLIQDQFSSNLREALLRGLRGRVLDALRLPNLPPAPTALQVPPMLRAGAEHTARPIPGRSLLERIAADSARPGPELMSEWTVYQATGLRPQQATFRQGGRCPRRRPPVPGPRRSVIEAAGVTAGVTNYNLRHTVVEAMRVGETESRIAQIEENGNVLTQK